MRARYYDPSVGRFISEDSEGQGGNWFAYCSNDPVDHLDANGQWWWLLLALAALFVIWELSHYDIGPEGKGCIPNLLRPCTGRAAGDTEHAFPIIVSP